MPIEFTEGKAIMIIVNNDEITIEKSENESNATRGE